MSLTFKIKPDLSNVHELMDAYDEILSNAEGDLIIEGKTLHDANKDQPMHMRYYASKLIEIKALQKYIDSRANQVKGKLWEEFKERHSISLGTRDIDNYILKEPKYIVYLDLVAIVSETVQQYEVLMEAFRSRGFALRNITESRIAEVNEFIL